MVSNSGKGLNVSKTKRGGKEFGTEFWAGRGDGIMDGYPAGGHRTKKAKVLTHKKERRLQERDLHKQIKEV